MRIFETFQTKRQYMMHFEKDIWFEQVHNLSLSLESENLNAQTFQNLNYLKDLKIEVNGIPTIEANSFETLTNLMCLTLRADFESIPEFFLQNLKNLKELKIELNKSDSLATRDHYHGVHHLLLLNKNHFQGLDNLDTLSLRCNLTEDLDNLPNLKHLSLCDTIFDAFTFKGLEKLEKLILCGVKMNPNFAKGSFEKLQNLKHLQYVDNRNHTKAELVFIKEIFQNTPNSVEVLACEYDVFEALKAGVPSSSFIYGIKTLIYYIQKELNYKFYFDSGFKSSDRFAFHDGHLFPNLERLNLEKANYCKIPIESLKKVKNLRRLKLARAVLIGNDNDLINLEELSITLEIPKNIDNFGNLKKLTLSDLYPKIVLNENFLENLVHLEELSLLNYVFDSIDPNVQHLFQKLVNLKELSISGNNMDTIKSTYFQYLVNLQKLNLNKNRIDLIEPFAFKALANLTHLNLSSNKIKEINMNIFDGLHNLNALELKSNSEVITFQKDTLCQMVNLQRFHF